MENRPGESRWAFLGSFIAKNKLAKGESGPDFGSVGLVTEWDANGCHCGYVSFDRGDLGGLCGLEFSRQAHTLGPRQSDYPDRGRASEDQCRYRRIYCESELRFVHYGVGWREMAVTMTVVVMSQLTRILP